MWLQKHKVTPGSNNKAGRAPKILRPRVSTWLVTGAQWGWVCSLVSAFNLCSQTHTDTGLKRCGRSKRTTNCNTPGMGLLVWKQVLPAVKTCCHSQTEEVSLRAAEQRLRGWETSNCHHSSLQQVLPAHGHSSRPVLKKSFCKCHTLGKIVPPSILVWEPRNPGLGSYLRDIKPENK